MRISGWSSDVCSSDLAAQVPAFEPQRGQAADRVGLEVVRQLRDQRQRVREVALEQCAGVCGGGDRVEVRVVVAGLGVQGHEQGDGEGALVVGQGDAHVASRSEEHTSELQSLMRISYAVFCLKKKK